jgi:hypothetical protein
VGLTAFFYLPFALLTRPKTGGATGTYPPPWRSLYWPTDGSRLDALPVLLVPALVLAAVGAFAARSALRRAGSPRRAELGLLSHREVVRNVTVVARADQLSPAALSAGVACGLVGAGCVVFALLGHIGVPVALYGVNTWDLYVDASWAIPIFVAAGFGLMVARWRWTKCLLPLILAGSVVGAATVVQMAEASVIDGHVGLGRTEAQALFPMEADDQSDYRIGATTDNASDWVGAHHRTPIVRGYQNQGTVNVDWQFWIEQALYDARLSGLARATRLDWYAVKWLYSDNLAAHVDEALDADPTFQSLGSSTALRGFNLYLNTAVTPVASATTAPAALVVASSSAYPILFRALGPSGAGSTSIVPVNAGAFIDDLGAEDLARFPSVVVYEAQAHDWSRAARLLEDYVKGGGHLFIEGAGMPTEATEALQVVSPVVDAHKEVVGDWAFAPSANELVNGIDLRAFSKPIYDSAAPWEIAVADRLTPNAKIALSSGPLPVLVQTDLGRGQVVWSGMNLPYHVAAFDNETESRLLARLVAASSSPVVPTGEATRVNAEHQRVLAPAGATGVLFKETATPAWRATVDGEPAEIYAAGPGFMYVALSPGEPHRVEFTYHSRPVDRAGMAVSILTALLLVAFGLGVRPPSAVRRFKTRWLGHQAVMSSWRRRRSCGSASSMT